MKRAASIKADIANKRLCQKSSKPTGSSQVPNLSPNDSSHDLENINLNYDYSTEDINAILVACLGENPLNIHILAAASMDLSITNRGVSFKNYEISEQLQEFFQLTPAEKTIQSKMILPVCRNKHWLGFVFTLEEGKISHISYYNSLPTTEKVDATIKERVLEELRKTDRLAEGVFPIRAENQPYQKDRTSCGVILVENFIADVTGTPWNWEKLHSKTLLELRRMHLSKVKEKKQEHYATFSKQSIAEDLDIQRQIENQAGKKIQREGNSFSLFSSPEPRRSQRKEKKESLDSMSHDLMPSFT